MINDLKDKYDFELRLATKKEVDTLVYFIAEKKWEDSRKYIKSPKPKVIIVEKDDFISKERTRILELIGSKVLVQDYKKYNVSIFVYNYIREYDEDIISSLTSRVISTKKGMEFLENEDVLFNLRELKNSVYYKKKVKSGRRNRPSEESIQKTLEIKKYIEITNPEMNIDKICHEFGFSKTSYYRVIKWLEVRNM
ncbi:hypothetical protein [Aquimarina algiphila]|uniref:Helix-turn-helix domain-containing protein n=1 Tax=Aquimarina algiphila TaxID=2047982 RepID=A0A554VHH3_9FLAO|nr:hypothetical protein [Aquimarina algiphila]TSE06980.1 hypothetical protein FOF46_17305 [Aquimarina algiphila]